MLKKTWLMLIRDKVLILLIACFSILSTVICIIMGAFFIRPYMGQREMAGTFHLNFVLIFSAIFLLFFMFIAYEFFTRTKSCGLQECLVSTKTGELKIIICQVFVLGCTLFLSAFLIALTVIVVYFFDITKNPDFLLFSIRAVLHYLFLVPLAGIFFALLASRIKRRSAAYVMMILFAILNLGYISALYDSMYQMTGIDCAPFMRLFAMTPNVMQYVPDEYYVVPLCSYQYFAIFFWIFLSVACTLFLLQKNHTFRKFVAPSAVAAGCVVLFVLTILPASDMSMEVFGEKSDWDYYTVDNQKHEDAGYGVTQYDMNLKLGRQLKANVSMSLSDSGLPEYKMTLYHGYKLQKVFDQAGNPLDYYREGDYITVKNPGGLTKINLQYSGYHSVFYSNSQAVYLPGMFPYYPIPGFEEIYVDNSYVMEPPKETSLFSVCVQAPYHVYSNLHGDQNSFAGESNGVTLISGFLTELQSDDLYYLDSALNTTQEDKVNLLRESGVASMPEVAGKKIIAMPHHVQYQTERGNIFFSDHILTSSLSSIKEDWMYHNMPEEKRLLSECLEYMPEEGFDEEFLDDLKNYNISRDVRMMELFQKLVQLQSYCDAEELAVDCMTFLYDFSDMRSPTEFIDSKIESYHLNASD